LPRQAKIVPTGPCVFTGPNVYPQGQLGISPGSSGSGSACAIPAPNARATSADPAAMIGRLRISFTSIYRLWQHRVPGLVHRADTIDLLGRYPRCPSTLQRCREQRANYVVRASVSLFELTATAAACWAGGEDVTALGFPVAVAISRIGRLLHAVRRMR
jgi:hypothetical protein